MKPIRKIAAVTFAFALALPLTASGYVPFVDRAQAASVGAAASAQASSSVRPATESFSVMIKGKNVTRKAQLKKGDGYSLYVAGGYTFSPAKNKLYLTHYPTYQAQIERLPAGFDINKLRKQGMTELKKHGKVNSYSGSQLFEGPMVSADLYLQTSGANGTHNYVVWTSEKGDAYLFRVRVPESAFAGTFHQIIFNSLSTVLSN